MVFSQSTSSCSFKVGLYKVPQHDCERNVLSPLGRPVLFEGSQLAGTRWHRLVLLEGFRLLLSEGRHHDDSAAQFQASVPIAMGDFHRSFLRKLPNVEKCQYMNLLIKVIPWHGSYLPSTVQIHI